VALTGAGHAPQDGGGERLVSAVFAFTFVDNVIGRPDGIYIASAFIFCVLVSSAISRYQRATRAAGRCLDVC
jgi:hypothetical protein